MYCYVVDSDICYFIQDLCAYKFFLIGNCDFFFSIFYGSKYKIAFNLLF